MKGTDDSMNKLTLWMQVSVDGHAVGPAGEFDWPVVGPELHQHIVDELGRMAGFVYGRRVFEMMAAFWPTADSDPASTRYQVAYAQLWKPMPKYVLSQSLESAEWNTTIVSGDIGGSIAKLKEQAAGDLVFLGGPDTASTLMGLKLIDEYRLFVHPAVLGGGKRLFPESNSRTHLQLVGSRVYDDVVVELHYAQT